MEIKTYALPSSLVETFRENKQDAFWRELMQIVSDIAQLVDSDYDFSPNPSTIEWNMIWDGFLTDGSTIVEAVLLGENSTSMRMRKHDYTFDTSSGYKTFLKDVTVEVRGGRGSVAILITQPDVHSEMTVGASERAHRLVEDYIKSCAVANVLAS